MKVLGTALVSLLLHLVLGWGWTILGGVAGGFVAVRREGRGGWRTGALGVTLAWALLVLYNVVVAPGATGRMVEAFGGILGNLPGVLVVGLTLLVGGLLGLLGGGIGAQAARLVRRPARNVTA